MTKTAISVLTPTYNRAHTLHRAYDSLTRQKTRDFEWVVVDDGSTDDTPALLARWQAEADFPITWYRYGKNRGRNAAVNSGAKLVSGEYTLILDSDDALLDHALETIAFWRERTGIDTLPSVSPLAFRCVDEFGKLVGTLNKRERGNLPQEILQASTREAVYRLGLSFELLHLVKTKVCLERQFVELTNSEHCPLSVTHHRLSSQYETIYVDHPVRRYFRNDGVARLSDRPSSSVKWPRGNYLRALAILNNDINFLWNRPAVFLNAARKVTRLGLHIGRSPHLQFLDIANARARLLWAICIPGGCVGYVRDRIRGHVAPKAASDISTWGPAAPPEHPVLHPLPERFHQTIGIAILGPNIP